MLKKSSKAKSRTGKLRPEQMGVKAMLEKLGWTVWVVRNLKEFREATERNVYLDWHSKTGFKPL